MSGSDIEKCTDVKTLKFICASQCRILSYIYESCEGNSFKSKTKEQLAEQIKSYIDECSRASNKVLCMTRRNKG